MKIPCHVILTLSICARGIEGRNVQTVLTEICVCPLWLNFSGQEGKKEGFVHLLPCQTGGDWGCGKQEERTVKENGCETLI